MIRFATAKAERVLAVAFDRGNDGVELSLSDGAFDSVFAVGSRAPSQMRVVVNVCSIQKRAVSSDKRVSAPHTWTEYPPSPVEDVSRHEQLDRLLVDDDVAF